MATTRIAPSTDVPLPSELPALDEVTLVRVDRCNLCGSEERDSLWHVHRWTVRATCRTPIRSVVCRQCGLIYLTEILPLEILEHPGKHGGSTAYGLDMDDRQCERNFRRLYDKASQAWPFLEPHLGSLSGKRTLDVLCGSAGVVEFLAEHGAVAEGLDPSPQQSKWAIEKRGLTIHPIRLDQLDVMPDQRYHLITGLQMLNHYADASAVLNRLHALIEPDGYLYLEVLDFPHAVSRKPLSSCIHVDHPYMFSPESVVDYLRTHGFSVVAMETDREKRVEFGSSNHIHVLSQRVEQRVPLNPRPTAALDAKMQCLLSIAQYTSDQVGVSAAPVSHVKNKRKKLIKRLKSVLARSARRLSLISKE